LAVDVHTYHANRLLAAGLTDGGTAGLIWGFVGVSIGFTLVYASISEMASMYVTACEIKQANSSC
jgi:hypothetical protein